MAREQTYYCHYCNQNFCWSCHQTMEACVCGQKNSAGKDEYLGPEVDELDEEEYVTDTRGRK